MSQVAATQLSRLELAAWRGLLATYSEVIAQLDAELEREHGLSVTSYEVLLQLAEAPEGSLRMGELAERLFLSRSGLTRLVDRLAQAGIVERTACQSDRRGSYARLTAQGRELFELARPSHLRGIREHFLSHLDEDDLAHLEAIWRKLGVEEG